MPDLDPDQPKRLSDPWRADDADPDETQEWLDALAAVVRSAGPGRGHFLLKRLEEEAQQLGIVAHVPPYSAYRNTIPLEQQGPYPGRPRARGAHHVDHALERAGHGGARQPGLRRARRPHRAATPPPPRSSRSGFNHFFRAADDGSGGDLVFFQPHSAPGVYARAFLEGRLDRGAARATTGRRSAGTGLSLVSASLADAGVLAVPDRLDGPRPDQRDLPGALHALPRAPRPADHAAIAASGACSATARWTSPSRSAR